MLSPDRLDWRWLSAVEAAEYAESEAHYRLQDSDKTVVDAYKFKRALDAGLSLRKWSAISAAYELFTDRHNERLFIEGMLLGGADNEFIANYAACDPQDVQAYHDLFFEVRPRLDKVGWVVAQLFGGNLYGTTNPRDKVGVLHRVAWLGGQEVFLAYYTGRRSPKLSSQMNEIIKDMLAKQSLLASMCLVGRDEVNIDLVRVFVDVVKAADETAKTIAGPNEQLANSIMGFVRNISLNVADPTDPNNLNLPGREPRAHEYLEGLKHVDQADVR